MILVNINNIYPWVSRFEWSIYRRRRLTAYIAHVTNIYSDTAARTVTIADDRIVKMA